ncbi:MAG: S-layer homology domain-containing protein, partial [Clostridiales bacterium]|nr:S-layer homology domain-containing protein [Clostridiales bacterium]
MWQKAKVLLAVVLVLTMMLALGSLALANDYSNHWSVHFIDDAISRGWMMGDGKGNYRPEAAITRGEFAVMLWRSLGQPQSEEGCPFDDVSEDAFYYSAVTALYEAGIVNGMSSDVFGPNITLTREMGCAMLARAYKLSPADIYAYQRFVDANAVSEWARLAVSALVEKDYIAGVGDNRIAPLQQLKRGEMAKLLVVAHDGAYTEKVEETPAHIEDDEAPIITTNVAVTMYTVTFDANGGSGAPEAETVAFNTRIAQPVKI